ncbi:hypothetical protein A5729_03570 [Mycobacterium vulneris]|nr:hypothetical protein A5729_03570 [Mycolicibacterium vulneris]
MVMIRNDTKRRTGESTTRADFDVVQMSVRHVDLLIPRSHTLERVADTLDLHGPHVAIFIELGGRRRLLRGECGHDSDCVPINGARYWTG